MNQYEYKMFNKKSNRLENARATAKNADIARMQIILAYGSEFHIMDSYPDINPPHKILGEIDCSNFPDSDMDWLKSRVNL
jgi:hypothetical protein